MGGSKSKKGSGRKSKKRMRKAKKVDREVPCGPSTYYGGDFKKHLRSRVSWKVEAFKSEYFYAAAKSKVPSTGITWVALEGPDTICVVIKKKNLHLDKVLNMGKKRFLNCFMSTIAHEMQDPKSDLLEDYDLTGPFAVVSTALGIDGANEESDHEHEGSIAWPGKNETIDFLKGSLENVPAPTHVETVQMAISALEKLHQEDFNAGDILVHILMEGMELSRKLSSEEIKQFLTVIHPPVQGN